MDNLYIGPTKYTPEINFDATKDKLWIKGESYPENITEFYGPVFFWLEKYLAKSPANRITVNIDLVYFNSSSSKILLDFLDMMEEAAKSGSEIRVNWIYDKEDEDNREFGEEFQEDFEWLNFHLMEREDSENR